MSELADVLELLVRLVAKEVAHAMHPEMSNSTASLLRIERELEQIKSRMDGSSAVDQIPSTGTCWTCTWFGGKICQRAGSPYHNKHVSPSDTCAKYLETKNPRGEIIKKVGEPRRINGAGPSRVQLTEVCPDCGHEVRVTKNGKLYAHDLDGHIYRGRGGDQSRPCVCQEDEQ